MKTFHKVFYSNCLIVAEWEKVENENNNQDSR